MLDRAIIDKNARIGDGARLTNLKGVAEADGDNYFIRAQMPAAFVVGMPKGAIIAPGTVV